MMLRYFPDLFVLNPRRERPLSSDQPPLHPSIWPLPNARIKNIPPTAAPAQVRKNRTFVLHPIPVLLPWGHHLLNASSGALFGADKKLGGV
jgi:hypothetical protein